MILGLGHDTIDIRRIEKTLERFGDRFIQRIYTDKERARAERRPLERAATYAKRFAAKEATAKALGTGLGEVSPTEIEIVRGASGEPLLSLSGDAKAASDKLGLKEWAISLSHTGNYAVASVVAIG